MHTDTNQALYTIGFFDSLEGWAVGDSGKILHYTTVGIEEKEVIMPSMLEVQPNPCMGSAIIRYQVPSLIDRFSEPTLLNRQTAGSKVRLKLYNLSGRCQGKY